MTIHLRPAVAGGLLQPTRKPRASSAQTVSAASGLAFLVLLRVGFTELRRSPGALVVSYTTVSPLPGCWAGRSVLCGTVPRVTPGGCYPPPCSAESGLSSARLPGPRSPGRLVRAASLASPTASNGVGEHRPALAEIHLVQPHPNRPAGFTALRGQFRLHRRVFDLEGSHPGPRIDID